MDKILNTDLTQVKRSDFRSVKQVAVGGSASTVIDGDFVELYLSLPR
jgi:hypothetical protein